LRLSALLAAGLLTASAALAQLEGVIDVHAHVDPETIPRSVDAMDLARLARKEGMRGVVFKNHYFSTAPIAWLVAREVPGVQVFGGIALNSQVGGINPAAVEHMVQLPGRYGRIVWMPTQDAETTGSGGLPNPAMGAAAANRRRVPVVRNGELLPEVREVLAIVARENLALATGHATPETTLLLIREARKMGINRIVVTHPTNRIGIEQQKEAAKLGAFLEYCFVGTLEFSGAGRRTFEEYASYIRAVGPEHAILSSDLGNAANPVHTAGWKSYIAGLLKAGITQAEIDIIAKRNPARLLGLE
jgi:Family of unknown function (DUF6282)